MASPGLDILVVGAGIFGICAARELKKRGHRVHLMDPGPLPHPNAASTDISKIVRADYGADKLYAALADKAIQGWRSWNEYFGEDLYHEVGLLIITRRPLTPGTYEYDSMRTLEEMGYPLERLDAGSMSARYPEWSARAWPAGYFNPRAGWVSAQRAVELLLWYARECGVETLTGLRYTALLGNQSRVRGVVDQQGGEHHADLVIVAAGAWTPKLLPHLADDLSVTGQPVVHFEVDDPRRWQPPRFPPWCGDIATTGWYGFPAVESGILKMGNHGSGRAVDPDAPRTLTQVEVDRFRSYVHEALPELELAPIASTRLCLYCDTRDGHFWIDHDPDRPGLMVASGGSGHAFKFAPLLGPLVADVAEGIPNAEAARFCWRHGAPAGREAARPK